MLTQKKRLNYILLTIILLLLIPLLAMQYTNEVNWSIMDFVIAGILLFGAGFAIEFILRKVKSRKNRIIICGIILLLLLLIWVELAVGLFGSSMAGN